MKLSKDEIDEVVVEFCSRQWGNPTMGADTLRSVLTRKFGEQKDANPFAPWRGPVLAGITTFIDVPREVMKLVPELWAAAVGVDATYSDDIGCSQGNFVPPRLALRAVLAKIKAVSDAS